ncbi:MAG: Cof-type HAD-IIB family hydrolase [Candidatus Ventricola sp.]|nr:Cof-type HAD-IIB family hydrolase [Candidatus Ventricola sp.]
MKHVRLVALDMDGTLLMSDHRTLPQRNIEAIRRADAAGIHVCIATGRMLEDASYFIHRYDLPCAIIAANGARASDGALPGGKILYRCSLTPEDAHTAIDLMMASGMMINGFEDGLVSTVQDETRRVYHLVQRGLIDVRYGEAALRAAADRGLMKLFAVGRGSDIGDTPDARIAPLRKALMHALPHLQITSSASGNIEVMPAQAGKGAALERLAVHFGLTGEEVMAMGDAQNDLSMLQYAAHSVAMGNATPEVRTVCRHETLSNDECGVAAMIDRVLAAKEV